MQHNVEVARWPAKGTGFSQARKADTSAIFHAGGNLGIYRALPQDAPLSAALRTRIGNDAACALACRTSAGDAEESLLVAYLSPSRARAATYRSLPRRRACATTLFADFMATNRNLGLGSEDGLLKIEIHVLAQIRTTLRAAALAAAAAEHLPNAKEISKDVAEVLENGGIESRTCRRSTRKGTPPRSA